MGLQRMSERLNAPEIYKTNFPFPVTSAKINLPAEDDKTDKEPDVEDLKTTAHPSEKVQVEVCSELSSFARPFDLFGNADSSAKESQRKLSLIHDTKGQPMIFTVSNTGQFYCVCYINGATAGWQSFNVTPPSRDAVAVVDAFDTLELGNKVHIVVSMDCKTSEDAETSLQEIWYTTFDKPELGASGCGNQVTGFSDQDLTWNTLASTLSDRNITSVLCSPSTTSAAGFHIVIGTATHDRYAAGHYLVDPVATYSSWQPLVMSGSADELLCMQPLALGSPATTAREAGIVSVFRQTGGNEKQVCTAEIFDERSGQRIRTYVMQTGVLGSVNTVHANVNPWGLTDLFVAGTKGIGFYDASAIEALKGAPILPNISFKQVVSSEVYGNPACSMAIFALSEHNELFFIEGKRALEGNKVSFKASGIPIRTDVTVMSPQYNAQSQASEILYVTSTNANGMRHLVRDPVSSLWAESSVEIKLPAGTPGSLKKVPAYMTSIAFTNGNGVPVSGDYSVNLMSKPPTHVTCNGRSVILDARPTPVVCNSQGQLDLVIPPDSHFGACELKLQLTQFKLKDDSKTDIITVNPAQRVVNIMSSMDSEEDMKSARGPDGQPVFDEVTIAETSPLLTQFGGIARQVSDQGKDPSLPGVGAGNKETTLAMWERRDGKLQQIEETADWIDQAMGKVGNFLGDVVECLKFVVKGTVKFAIKLVAKTVKIVFSYAGKLFSALLPDMSSLISTVFAFLKAKFKEYFPRLAAFLELVFDVEYTKKTQKVFKDLITGGLDHAETFLVQNKYRLSDWMDDMQKRCAEFIPDARLPPAKKEKDSKASLFSRIFNNPIIKALLSFNPIAWVMEGISEGFSEEFDVDGLQIPSVQPIVDLFVPIMLDTGEKALENILRGFFSVVHEISSLGMSPDPDKIKEALWRAFGDVFHTAFDNVKLLVNAFWDVLIQSLRMFKEVLCGVWKIPGLTDMWESYAEQEFSILNFGTYLFAIVWNAMALIPEIFGGGKKEGPSALDELGAFSFDSISTPWIETEKLEKLSKQPPGPNDLVVMMNDTNKTKEQQADTHKGSKNARLVIDTLSNCVRVCSSVLEIYATKFEYNTELAEADHVADVQGAQAADGMRIVGNRNVVGNRRNVVVPTGNDAMPPAYQNIQLAEMAPAANPVAPRGGGMPRAGVNPLRDQTTGALVRAQIQKNISKRINGMFGTMSTVFNTIGTSMTIASFSLKVSIMWDEKDKTSVWTCGTNMICQIVALIATVCAVKIKKAFPFREILPKLAAVVQQAGSIINWVGDYNAAENRWWNTADLVGTCGTTLAAALAIIADICKKNPKAYWGLRLAASLGTATDVVCAGLVVVFFYQALE